MTIDLDDIDSMLDFRSTFDDLMGERDHFPNAQELSEEEREEFIEFLDEYDLWDEFRDEWEDYEKA